MKKKIKKTIVMLGVSVILLCSSMTALAASCLNVRDYGRHRYNHRVESVSETKEVRGITGDGEVCILITKVINGFCVCGKYGTDIEYEYQYIPMP